MQLNKFTFSSLSTSLVAGLLFASVSPSVAVAGTSTSIAGLVNLAPASVIQTTTTGPSDSLFSSQESQYNYPITGSSLWHAFLRQTGRDITVTLPQNSSIQTISIQFEQLTTSGIYYPNHVDFEANDEGQWYKVASESSVVPLTDKRTTTQTFTVHLNGLQTNQIRIHFPVNVWVFARRLEVWGTPRPGGTPELPSGATVVPSPAAPPRNDEITSSRGIHNMLLVYNDGYGNLGTWSPTDFAPLIGYTSQSGQVLGPMFDTMLFLPFTNLNSSQQSWQSYLQNLFTKGQQLDALNTAVGERNQLLGTYSQSEKVVLDIPYPTFGSGNWGYANGQNITFNSTPSDPSALSGRNNAINWYVQTLLSDWNSANLSNLQLVGFYWYQEDVDYGSPGEVTLVTNTASLVHQLGYGLYWIPYYDAPGLTIWKQLGFDEAFLQPNFIEQGASADLSRVADADAYAKQLGLGVELELSGDITSSTVQSLYSETINQMETDGMTSSVPHAYYNDPKDFITSASSTDSGTRSLYDQTYSFMQHP